MRFYELDIQLFDHCSIVFDLDLHETTMTIGFEQTETSADPTMHSKTV